jgi:hypothetical protein
MILKKLILIILSIILIPCALLAQTLDQRLFLITNSGTSGGDFIVEYQVKGTNLTSARTLASLNADIIYDTTILQFNNGVQWNQQISDANGYSLSIQSNHSEQGKFRAIRIAISAPDLNSNPLNPMTGFDIESIYAAIVRMNFTILNQCAYATLLFKNITNEVGLFVNPNNLPNTFDITAVQLSEPETIREAPLPVQLTAFTSLVKANEVQLEWKTAMEQNNRGFEIERKTENESWILVGFVNGKGNSNTLQGYKFNDKNLRTGNYNYRIKQIDYNGNFQFYNLQGIVIVGIPSKYSISQNFPNPFNPLTKINYEVAADSKVKIIVYDVSGKEIKTLTNEKKQAGYYSLVFNAANLPSGTYFYRIYADEGSKNYFETKKMILIK